MPVKIAILSTVERDTDVSLFFIGQGRGPSSGRLIDGGGGTRGYVTPLTMVYVYHVYTRCMIMNYIVLYNI
jgi:hypothetical protein